MRISRISENEFELDIPDFTKTVTAKVPEELNKKLDQMVTNKSALIRSVLLKIVTENIDISSIKTEMNRKNVISVKMRYSEFVKVKKFAKRNGISVSELINRAIALVVS